MTGPTRWTSACSVVATVFLVLAGAGYGGGGASGTRESALPAGWKRCTNQHVGFSIGYPGTWYTDSIDRVRAPGTTAPYKQRFFSQFACTSFDPRPFTLVNGSELPTTAIEVRHRGSVREATRYKFDPTFYRVLSRQWVRIGTHRALRYEMYSLVSAPLYPHTSTYGYVIDFGKSGAIIIEARRFAFRKTTQAAYLSYKRMADQMAPTARITSRG